MALAEESVGRRSELPIRDRVLGKADIDARYTRIREAVDDPSHGLFGPDSMMWRMIEPLPVLPFMLTMAGFLEGAAPKIWFGTEYSVTRSGDYSSRFARSYDAFMDWFVGDVDTALRRGRKVFGYHSRVGGVAPHDAGHVAAGQEYRATEQQLMLFTVGTQIVPIKQCYELLHGDLTAAECERYWQECRTFCDVFGIDPEVVPATWPDFERYWDGCLASGELEAPKEGYSRYGPLMATEELPRLARIVLEWFVSLQFNLMPEHLRAQYAEYVPLAAARPHLVDRSFAVLRVVQRVVPGDLLRSPRVREARRRVGLEGRPGMLGRWLASRLRHPVGDAQPTMTTPASAAADPEHSPAFRVPPV